MDIAAAETAHFPTATVDRRVQVDGLRALAMIGVLYVHLWDNNPLTQHLRVQLFFVVSGFLITHILLAAKERSGQINVLNFYVRRSLRLAPALIVLVVVASIFDMDGFRSSAFWHVFQLSNIYFAATESVKPWVAGHLWSLNCLEQFYLVCPLVILLSPLRRIYVLAIAAWIGAVFVRTNGAHFGINGWWTFFVLPFDSIAAGVLACLLMKHEKVAEMLASPAALAGAAVVLFLPRFLWAGFGASESYRLLCEPALCVIVAGAFQGYRGPVGWLLGNPLARFLSQISYGVYMYHLLVWWLVVQIFPDLFEKGARTFIVISLLTIIVATASWYLIEQPISKLKDRFPTGASTARKKILLA